MSSAKSIFYVASGILIIFLGSFSLATWNSRTLIELQQQVVGAYEWVQCKVHGGTPQRVGTEENYYHLECKKV